MWKYWTKLTPFYKLTIQRFSVEWKYYVRNGMKLKNNNGMWCFSADKEHTPLIIFVWKQWLPIPRLLVPVSATRARIDLEVLYWNRQREQYWQQKRIQLGFMRIQPGFSFDTENIISCSLCSRSSIMAPVDYNNQLPITTTVGTTTVETQEAFELSLPEILTFNAFIVLAVLLLGLLGFIGFMVHGYFLHKRTKMNTKTGNGK